MNELFLKIINMSISASWLILAVLILRLVLKKAPKWVNVLLWGIVAVRLVCPFSFESALSLIPSAETIPLDIGMDTTPTINSGINAINNAVNPIIGQSNTPMAGASANPLQITIGIYEYIWIFGMIALALYTAISYWRLRRKVDTATRTIFSKVRMSVLRLSWASSSRKSICRSKWMSRIWNTLLPMNKHTFAAKTIGGNLLVFSC